MSLFFLSPAFLLILPLAALPPVIHLLSRKKKTVVFSSVLLLENIAAAKKRLRRWQKILLMLLRSSAIAFLAGAAAEPWLSFGAGRTARDSAVVFLFDASMSRSWRGIGTSELEAAKKTATEILDKLPAETPAGFAVYSDRADTEYSPPDTDRTSIKEHISRIRPTAKATNHAAGLAEAAKILGEAGEGRKTIVWFTDRAAHGFEEISALPDGSNLVVVSDDKTGGNATVAGYVQSLNKMLTVRLKSYGFEGPLTLAFHENGEARGSMPVAVKNGENKILTFWRAAGNSDCRFEIKGDALDDDNSYRFRTKRDTDEKILVADGNPLPGRMSEIYYVVAALTAGGHTVISVRANEFRPEMLRGTAAAVFSNFWPSHYAKDVDDYIAGGGKAVLFAGQNLAESEGARGIEITAERSERATAEADATSQDLPENAASFDWRIISDRAFELNYGGDYRAPIKRADGIPLLVTDGNFSFVNATADRAWSDLPAKSAFAPLLKTLCSTKDEDPDIYSFAGKSAADAGAKMRSVKMKYGGKIVDVGGPENLRADEPGIYKIEYLRDGRRREANFIVNTEPRESDCAVERNIGRFVKNAAIFSVDDADAGKAARLVAGKSAAAAAWAIFAILVISENILVFLINKK